MNVDVGTIVTGVIISAVGGMLAAMLRGQNRKLDNLATILGQINGRLGRVEEWKVNHDITDLERHVTIDKRTDELRYDVNANRESLHRLSNELAKEARVRFSSSALKPA